MEKLHFFSHESRVSLELPIGWEELSEENHQVVYYYEDFEEDDSEKSWINDPRFMIKLFPSPSTDIENLERASTSSFKVEHEQLEKFNHTELKVDGYPGILDIFSYKDSESRKLVSQFQLFVLIDNVIFSFTGLMLKKFQDRLIPVFNNAIQSVRFIFE